MLVKIDNVLFDTAIQPIMLILDSEEKELINDMGDQSKLCIVPLHYTEDEIREFINEKIKKPDGVDVPTIIINYVIPGILLLILLTIIFH